MTFILDFNCDGIYRIVFNEEARIMSSQKPRISA